MIRARHAKDDLNGILTELAGDEKTKARPGTFTDVVRVVGLVIKILLDVRANQVRTMEHLKIPLREPRPERTEETGKTE